MRKNDPIIQDDDHDHEEDEFGRVVAVRKNLFLFGEINVDSTGQFLAAFDEADSKPGMTKINICSMGRMGGRWPMHVRYYPLF